MEYLSKFPKSNKTGWPWDEEVIETVYNADGVQWPKITIVTPSFNQGKFIEETIRSVILQNYPNLEYILMDGGSSDETLEIIQKYQAWISFWVSEPDEGQSDALIKGFNRATGDIMNWINSDDILCKDGLFHIAQAFISNPGTDFIHGRNGIMSADSVLFSYMPHPKDNLKMRYLYEMPYGQQACFFSRQLYKDCGGINKELRFSMDFEMYLRMHNRNIYTYQIENLIGNYRVHENSKTTNWQSIMQWENGNAFMTFLFCIGHDKKANFFKDLGHKKYYEYKSLIAFKPSFVRKIFCLYLKKNIWYYYNNGDSNISGKMALEIIKNQFWQIFNLNYIKLIKENIFKS